WGLRKNPSFAQPQFIEKMGSQDAYLENTRPASQDDILELAGNGVRPIDVTVTELEDQPGTGECE
ncbi:MAG: hypothetical protein KGL33_01480, partial [Betaproteobacteria bacterium]|nr:hypothetical protein [Betaproteobacteria bacterium]